MQKYIIFILFFINFNLCDYSYPWQISFQDPATPIMEGIISLHHDLMFILTIIGFTVIWFLLRTTYLFYYQKNTKAINVTHNTIIEIVWTLTPSFILMVISIPSFSLLYAIDEVVDPAITIKVIGRQWFWSYEYNDFCDKNGKGINFESYMLNDYDLHQGQIRLLEVDNKVVLPKNIHIRALVTSGDVLHSWAIPSLGIKIDACPGRLNQVSIFIKRVGIFYGQCSELCGTQHGFMPIVIESVSIEKYIQWITIQTEYKYWFFNKLKIFV